MIFKDYKHLVEIGNVSLAFRTSTETEHNNNSYAYELKNIVSVAVEVFSTL